MLDGASLAVNFANVVNLFAVLLLMRTIIIDRKVIKGFSVSGTFLTCIAGSGLTVGFLLLDNLFSFALSLFTLVFWVLAFSFSLRRYLQREKN